MGGATALAACGKTQKYVIPNPVRFLNGVRNLLFPWFSCEQQIPHPQTTRVRDDKSDFFPSLLGNVVLKIQRLTNEKSCRFSVDEPVGGNAVSMMVGLCKRLD
jgi:hypothetical protein